MGGGASAGGPTATFTGKPGGLGRGRTATGVVRLGAGKKAAPKKAAKKVTAVKKRKKK